MTKTCLLLFIAAALACAEPATVVPLREVRVTLSTLSELVTIPNAIALEPKDVRSGSIGKVIERKEDGDLFTWDRGWTSRVTRYTSAGAHVGSYGDGLTDTNPDAPLVDFDVGGDSIYLVTDTHLYRVELGTRTVGAAVKLRIRAERVIVAGGGVCVLTIAAALECYPAALTHVTQMWQAPDAGRIRQLGFVPHIPLASCTPNYVALASYYAPAALLISLNDQRPKHFAAAEDAAERAAFDSLWQGTLDPVRKKQIAAAARRFNKIVCLPDGRIAAVDSRNNPLFTELVLVDVEHGTSKRFGTSVAQVPAERKAINLFHFVVGHSKHGVLAIAPRGLATSVLSEQFPSLVVCKGAWQCLLTISLRD